VEVGGLFATAWGMFRTFQLPISWAELFKRTVKEFMADNCLGLAAQVAYYLLLGLVPALVFLVAITSFLPPQVIGDTIATLTKMAPPEMAQLIREQLQELTTGQSGGLLTFGFLMALWSSSAATSAIVDALNRAYDIEEGRPWWKVRLTAIALTLALALFMLLAIALVLGGPAAADWLTAHAGMGRTFAVAWKIVQWPVVFLLVAAGLGILNYFAPDAEQDWEWITPGALAATLLWFLGSLAFRVYVVNFGSYNETYGTLGGVIVLMLWFYLSGLAILAGAEMNAEIEHASPHGKAPGEKVPGEKKLLGARAARAFEAAQKEGKFLPRPAAPLVPQPAAVIAARERLRTERSSGWLVIAAEVGLAMWAYRRTRERKAKG
jgi:membrane protein